MTLSTLLGKVFAEEWVFSLGEWYREEAGVFSEFGSDWTAVLMRRNMYVSSRTCTEDEEGHRIEPRSIGAT